MQQAKAEAHRILDTLRGRDFGQVVAFDAHVENMTQPEPDRGTLSAAIDSIQPSDLASSFGELARAMRVTEQSTGMQLQVHLVSDMQQTSLPAEFRDLEMGHHSSLELHSVGRANAPNWAVETVTAPAHVYSAAHTRLIATLAGWHTPATQKTISLLLDGKQIGSRDVAVPANGRAQAEFIGFEVPYGAHRGEVRMEPHDDLPNDDSFFFSTERSDPRKVLFLYAGGRSQASFYYKTAMESASDTGLVVQAEAIELAGRDDLSKFAYVVLSDIADPGDSMSRALAEYVRGGGSVLVALGPAANHGRIPVSGERITELDESEGAGFVDHQHPALDARARFDNVQFFESARLLAKPDARVIAKLADGSPLLVEEHIGEGKLLIFASTLDNSGNDFPLHASFVPFVAQTGRYLAGMEEAASNAVTGTPVLLRRNRAEATAADVVGPDGKHELPMGDAGKALMFDLAREGFYEIQRADGHRVLMAVHADRRESDLSTIPAETLVLWRNTGNAGTEANPAGMTQQTQPWNLWRYVLLLVLAAALLESVFASRYLQAERQTA